MTGNKDSVEVAGFMTLFSKLKDWIGDYPDQLLQSATEDSSIRDLCVALWWSCYSLRESERRSRHLFVAPVDPKFLEAWRDFEQRYERLTAGVFCNAFLTDDVKALLGDSSTTPGPHHQWESAEYVAVTEAAGIEGAIEFAHEQADNAYRDFPEGFSEAIEDGYRAWQSLKDTVGLDLRGVFRRRKLIPFVLIPRHVAAKQGNDDRLSMLESLRQAHDAFIFGAPYAALALMRSIMEAVLRDHYGAKGADLCKRIDNARHLPPGASVAALHRLRKLTNRVVHLGDGDQDILLSRPDLTTHEEEIVSLWLVLRSLIENAPKLSAR